MASRMQQYRARMKARGLMQVTVWANPEHAAAIREYAQQLLDGASPVTEAVDPPAVASEETAQASVTGDDVAATPPADSGRGESTSAPQMVTGDTQISAAAVMPGVPSADALEEVTAEVASWDAELANADELQRHEEVLQELRQWLKELEGSEPDIQLAIEQILNARRKRVKQLKRQRR